LHFRERAFPESIGERGSIAIAGEPGIAITAIEPAEIMLVDTADIQTDLLE